MIPNPKNKQITIEWQKLIMELLEIADELEFGEIIITVQNKKPVLTRYIINRKSTDIGELRVIPLGD
jgi:hypothetical protein